MVTVPLTAVRLPAAVCAAARCAPNKKITATIIAVRAKIIGLVFRSFTRFLSSHQQHLSVAPSGSFRAALSEATITDPRLYLMAGVLSINFHVGAYHHRFQT